MRGTTYQICLIALLIAVTAMFGVFFYRELFPEYKVYQNAYVDLEKFRASLTHEPLAPFEFGVKQIVISKPDQGPETIDRCTSCHVALQLDYFSPTKIARDINGDVIRDANGNPVTISNDQYIFHLVDEQIKKETDPAKIKALEALKTAKVHGHSVDIKKVLAMHPLMGKELRPFEFHSPNEIGCTSCHNGNGRALTTEKAHGPVLDGHYEEAFEGPKPHFLESDSENDPLFSKVFNHKPGHQLLFQTTPLFVGGLIQANCVQCHRSSNAQINTAVNALSYLNDESQRHSALLKKNYETAKEELLALWKTQKSIESQGVEKTIADWQQVVKDYSQPQAVREQLTARIRYLQAIAANQPAEKATSAVQQQIDQDLQSLVGGKTLVDTLLGQLKNNQTADDALIEAFVTKNLNSTEATGRLFAAQKATQTQNLTLAALEKAHTSVGNVLSAEHPFLSEVDLMTSTYREGQTTFMSQACYACHRIGGYSRGGVGPELTMSGNSYPWFLKQKIIWPQGDLKTSTMPNMRLDHTQLEALMTFLLAQKGQTRAISDVDHQINLKQWESGKKLPWEEPLSPDQIHNLDHSMTIFAAEGCAACHRLKGFKSNVGFTVEKNGDPSLATLTVEREWFRRIIPELVGDQDIPGSLIVNQIEQYADEIDRRIAGDVRQESLIERIAAQHPGLIESFYSNFAYAQRHKNSELSGDALKQWHDRVHRVLMMYVQEYGLGRLIGPRPNWSGIYRSDEWLMEHFREPSALIARSLMPVFPFDTTKFAALTYMLNQLGKRNLEANHALWELNGFSPEEAYHLYCSQCHGVAERRDDAPVAKWIYPIPKNLRNAIFLRNLTRPRIIESLTKGVEGTPMPPWGATPQDKPFPNHTPVLRPNEIVQLTDWLLRLLPESGERGEQEVVPKWEYTPEDVIKDLKREGDTLEQLAPKASKVSPLGALAKRGVGLLASLTPTVAVTDSADGEVSELFDITQNSEQEGTSKTAYYIKQKYFTPENIEAGRSYFALNCAVCHGAEGGGDGTRAQEMSDAKPRMFTNAIWGRTRDDLRLLRSIKYGVPGTSMVPWGDLTSSLQRLQLVIYIRHLSKNIEAKDELSEVLYQSFDNDANRVRDARIQNYAKVTEAKANYEAAELHRQKSESDSDIAKAYEQEVQTQRTLNQSQDSDQNYTTLLNSIAEQRTLYERGGKVLLNAQVDPAIFQSYLTLIKLNRDRFQFKDGKLTLSSEQVAEHQRTAANQIFDSVKAKIAELTAERKTVQGQIASAEQRASIKEIDDNIKGLEKLSNELTSLLADAARLSEVQRKLYELLGN